MILSLEQIRSEHGKTKQEILILRKERVEAEIDNLGKELNRLLTEIHDDRPFGRPCCGCWELLETEKDFREHFIVSDSRYLNLGYCPVVDRP